MILAWLLDLKFLNELAAKVAGTSNPPHQVVLARMARKRLPRSSVGNRTDRSARTRKQFARMASEPVDREPDEFASGPIGIGQSTDERAHRPENHSPRPAANRLEKPRPRNPHC